MARSIIAHRRVNMLSIGWQTLALKRELAHQPQPEIFLTAALLCLIAARF
jgi:hypothetical protein